MFFLIYFGIPALGFGKLGIIASKLKLMAVVMISLTRNLCCHRVMGGSLSKHRLWRLHTPRGMVCPVYFNRDERSLVVVGSGWLNH